MKILHVIHQFPDAPAGGTERNVAAIAAAMTDAGHEVLIVAGSLEVGAAEPPVARIGNGVRVFELRRDDLYFESWEKAWSPSVGDAFAALLERERPDVVHVQHWLRLTTDLVRIAQDAGVDVVACTLHDHWSMLGTPVRPFRMDLPEPPPAARWVGAAERREAFALHRDDMLDEVRAADLRFAPSRAHVASIAAMAPGALGEVIAVPTPLLDVPGRLAEEPGPRGKRLVFWGSLYPEKGIEIVIDALASIGSGWSLEVFGDAPDPAYGAMLRQRSAAFPVTFHGRYRIADLAAIRADYAVFPATSHESYGLVLDEAFCLGLPVLAADLPAFREHGADSACLFFEPNDPGSLAMLLCDEARLQRLARPLPRFTTAAVAADALLAGYAAARRGDHGPVDAPVLVTPRARARALFRRAERRLWSALQTPAVRTPPDEFLGT